MINRRMTVKKYFIFFTTFLSVASHASFLDVNPELGAYYAKAYTSHDASSTVRAGTCALNIIDKKFDDLGHVKSVEVIYKSSRSLPMKIVLTRTKSGELVGSANNEEEAYTSDNPVIEMIGSGNNFGILISTNKSSFAAAAGMDGERQCHNFEENPMTFKEFNNY